MLVSVCMIVKNEEIHIARALQSIPHSFEKIVIDTGSTDLTKEIAARNGAIVGHFDWVGDFSAARNFSISMAQGDYILILDADETLEKNSTHEIEEFIQNYPNQAGTVTIHNFIGNEIHKHRGLRFFPNHHGYYFEGIVHESIYKNEEPAEFESSNIILHHFGYQPELYENGVKAKQYLDLYQQHLSLNPHDGYMHYQLGKLHYSLGEFNSALDAFERCLDIDEQGRLYYPAMIVMLGNVLKNMGQSILAEELLTPFIVQYPDFPDISFAMGLLAMETGKVSDIEKHFLRALNIGETTRYSSLTGVGSFKAAYNLGVFYEMTDNRMKAIEYYKISALDSYQPAIERLLIIN